MFTNEIEFDTVITTVLDETAQVEDVHIIYTDSSVFIRQFNDDTNEYDLIRFTPLMFAEFLQSYKQTQGTFRIEMS